LGFSLVMCPIFLFGRKLRDPYAAVLLCFVTDMDQIGGRRVQAVPAVSVIEPTSSELAVCLFEQPLAVSRHKRAETAKNSVRPDLFRIIHSFQLVYLYCIEGESFIFVYLNIW